MGTGKFAILAAAIIAAKPMLMNTSLRKLIGGAALILFSVVYYALVITIAIARLPALATPWHMLFYCAAVVIWFIPCAVLIRWTLAPRNP